MFCFAWFGLAWKKNFEFFLLSSVPDCFHHKKKKKRRKLAFSTGGVREEQEQTKGEIITKDTANYSAAVTWPEGEEESSLAGWSWKLPACHSAEKTISYFMLIVT